MEKHIGVIGGRSRPSPAQISKNFKLYSECCPDEMSYIYSRDVRFVHKDEVPLAKSKMCATIEWPSGRWQFGTLQIMNPELRSLIEEGTIGREKDVSSLSLGLLKFLGAKYRNMPVARTM